MSRPSSPWTAISAADSAQVRMSLVEKVLLLGIIVSLPLEDHIRIIPGYSVQFVMFGVVAVYLLLVHPQAVWRTMTQPPFVCAYVFIVYCFTMEITAPHASYKDPVRIAQMIAGAVMIASICRDIHGLRLAVTGYLLAALWLSLLLFLTSYGAIQGAAAMNFDEASTLREEVFADNPIEANLNSMAFAAGQGAVVALAWALTTPGAWMRHACLVAGLVCLVASFLPLSRGGAAITLISCASVMYGFGLRHAKSLLIALVLGAAILAAVPDAVWSRMAVSFETKDGKKEGRAKVYDAALEHLPQYLLTGVGSGNFWSGWGRRSTFADAKGRVTGSHNSLLQVTLYWGIGGLAGFALIFWQAARCLPRGVQQEVSALCLLGIGVSVGLYALVIHNLYAKEFCLALGLLVGARTWVWPQGFISRPLVQQRLW